MERVLPTTEILFLIKSDMSKGNINAALRVDRGLYVAHSVWRISKQAKNARVAVSVYPQRQS